MASHKLQRSTEDIRRELKGTMIIISHQERILRAADEVLLLDGGRCVYDGPPQNALPVLEQVFQLRVRQLDGHLVLDREPEL